MEEKIPDHWIPYDELMRQKSELFKYIWLHYYDRMCELQSEGWTEEARAAKGAQVREMWEERREELCEKQREGWTDDARERRSIRLKEYWAKNRESMREKQKAGWTKARREAASIRMQGMNKEPKSDETKAKMSRAKKGRAYSPEHKANMKRVQLERCRITKEIQLREGITWREAVRRYMEIKNG